MSVAASKNLGAAAKLSAVLDERYEIFPDRVLPKLACGAVPAVAAIDRQAPNRRLFAYVCEPAWRLRHAAAAAIERAQHTGVLTPAARGVAELTAGHRRVAVLVYEHAIGERLVGPDAEMVAPLDADRISQHVLAPIAQTLRALSNAGATHRAIRPDNLFWRDATETEAVLGDCLAEPPGAAQPLWCETIESGLAHPLGRGDGSLGDDLYALGATALFLALGRVPGAAETDGDALLHAKIARGSYAALLGEDRLPPALAEAVAGLLADDPRRRWTLDELDAWLKGKGAPLRHALAPRTTRNLEFDGRAFDHPRLLAAAFAAKPLTAAATVRSDPFAAWVQRWHTERWAAVETALAAQRGRSGASADELLVARVCIALDPAAPIRFRGLGMHVDGCGPLLGAAFSGGLPLQAVVGAIVGRLPQFWLAIQQPPLRDAATLRQSLDALASLVEHRDIGCGPERGFYELMPHAPCLSPVVDGMGVTRPEQLLAALGVATASKPLTVDRHLAAFLAARFKSGIGNSLLGLESQDAADQYLAALRVLSRLQEAFGPTSLPSLTASLAKQSLPAIERFRNRTLRRTLSDSLESAAAKGRVVELLALLDDPAKHRGDAEAFRAARREYGQLRAALEGLARRERNREREAAALGARYAARVAAFAAVAGLAITALVLK